MAEGRFTFDGQEYAYFAHPYNRAGENMRTVEVPIAYNWVRGREWDRILEVGHVLGHYGLGGWPVLDARERGPAVITADLMRWQPAEPLDRIVSISTLEHVGHGRYADLTAPGATPEAALARMRSWLAPGGEALFTVPLGYNPALDRAFRREALPVARVACMRRVSAANEWAECTAGQALAARRPAGYRWAVAMAALFCRGEGQLDTLNLGAGNRPIKGAVNHDLRAHAAHVDVAHDLNERPWPWADESFDRIVARAVLEHLDIDLVASLDECWRLLRPGGTLYLKLPFWNSDLAHQDPTHRWFFSVKSFDQFDPERRRGREYDFYTDRTWQIVKAPRLNDARSSIHVTLRVRKSEAT
jgi:SAM-dependent methyltransferase